MATAQAAFTDLPHEALQACSCVATRRFQEACPCSSVCRSTSAVSTWQLRAQVYLSRKSTLIHLAKFNNHQHTAQGGMRSIAAKCRTWGLCRVLGISEGPVDIGCSLVLLIIYMNLTLQGRVVRYLEPADKPTVFNFNPGLYTLCNLGLKSFD